MSEFDLRVNREGLANLKHEFTPPEIRARDIEAFNAAEMDFSTAPCVKKALHEMIDRGIFGFTVQTPEYDERIAWWMKETRGMEIDPQWIVPVMGTIFSVATALRMTCEPDGRLIVLSPVYYRYEQAATRMGLETVRVPLKNDGERFSIDFAALETAMADPKNRLLVLCNPHNPTGNVWPEEDLRKIAILSAKTQTVVLSDEIFANDAFDGRRVPPYIAIEEGRPYAITCVSRTKPDTPPSSWRTDARAAASEFAPMSCMTASARLRSMRPLRNARSVNSPGLAGRAPSSSARLSTRRAATSPP